MIQKKLQIKKLIKQFSNGQINRDFLAQSWSKLAPKYRFKVFCSKTFFKTLDASQNKTFYTFDDFSSTLCEKALEDDEYACGILMSSHDDDKVLVV